MKQLWLIIKREYITKIRNKSFIIMTFISPLIILILGILIGYLTDINNNSQKNIIVFDESFVFFKTFKNTKTYLGMLIYSQKYSRNTVFF